MFTPPIKHRSTESCVVLKWGGGFNQPKQQFITTSRFRFFIPSWFWVFVFVTILKHKKEEERGDRRISAEPTPALWCESRRGSVWPWAASRRCSLHRSRRSPATKPVLKGQSGSSAPRTTPSVCRWLMHVCFNHRRFCNFLFLFGFQPDLQSRLFPFTAAVWMFQHQEAASLGSFRWGRTSVERISSVPNSERFWKVTTSIKLGLCSF